MLSAEAVGADEAVGVPGAVAVELVHNFSLLHDDVIDGDRERRHRPTVWALFGVGQAIIAGDALHTLAHAGAARRGHARGRAGGGARWPRRPAAMIAGQAVDMAFETRDDVTWDECLAMAGAKTGALLACAASLGAVLAGADAERVGGASAASACTSAWRSRPSTTCSASGASPR